MKFKALTMTLGVRPVETGTSSARFGPCVAGPGFELLSGQLWDRAQCSSRRLFGLAQNYGPPQIMGQHLQQRQCQHFLSATDRHLVHPA